MSSSDHPETKVGSQEWSEERFKEEIWESLPYSMSQNGVHRRRANKGKVNYWVILGIHSEGRKRKGKREAPFLSYATHTQLMLPCVTSEHFPHPMQYLLHWPLVHPTESYASPSFPELCSTFCEPPYTPRWFVLYVLEACKTLNPSLSFLFLPKLTEHVWHFAARFQWLDLEERPEPMDFQNKHLQYVILLM